MHTVKVELKHAEASFFEEKLLEIANDLGKPLNFSLLSMPPEAKKPSLLTGYFKNRAESLKQLKLLGLEKRAVHGYLKARDWQDSVKKHFKPFAYRNIIWAPEWVTEMQLKPLIKKASAANYGNSIVIKLHMGMAFGTGNHPTTRLCLRRCVEAVEFYLEQNKKVSVLDIGCGSGVLAITAERMGCKSAFGFDIDEHSITVAKRNARMNRSRAKFAVGDLYKDKLPKADIVFANLLANLIADNVKKLWASVNPGGVLLLSGLLKEELTTIAKLFPEGAIHYKLGKWGALAIPKP